MTLNIADLSRHARSQRAQAVGQAITLPLGNSAVCLIGILVTAAAKLRFGTDTWARDRSLTLMNDCSCSVWHRHVGPGSFINGAIAIFLGTRAKQPLRPRGQPWGRRRPFCHAHPWCSFPLHAAGGGIGASC